MDETEVKVKISKRGHCKGSLARLKMRLTLEYLKQTCSVQMHNILEERATSSFGEYETLNTLLDDGEDPTLTDNCYFHCVELIRTELAERKCTKEQYSSNSGSASKLKLPSVQITPFDGNYLEYRLFIEMFTALIHNDPSIDEVQKLFYLRNFLQDEAYDFIKNLPVVGSSYQEALCILKNHHDNKHRIIFEHLFCLFDLASMGNETNATALRQLISQVNQHIAALKNLGEAVDQWDSILVCLLIRKVDFESTRAYYLQHDNSAQTTLIEFLKFLEQRAFALENMKGKTIPSISVAKKHQQVSNVVSKVVDCLYCGKSTHKLFSCPAFMLATVDERFKFVASKNLCKVCLNSHKGNCRFYFKCQYCKKKHNSLLHKDDDLQGTTSTEEVNNVSLLSGTN